MEGVGTWGGLGKLVGSLFSGVGSIWEPWVALSPTPQTPKTQTAKPPKLQKPQTLNPKPQTLSLNLNPKALLSPHFPHVLARSPPEAFAALNPPKPQA